jgi:hypothetical protein
MDIQTRAKPGGSSGTQRVVDEFSPEYLREQRAAPHGNESQKQAADGVESCEQESA